MLLTFRSGSFFCFFLIPLIVSLAQACKNKPSQRLVPQTSAKPPPPSLEEQTDNEADDDDDNLPDENEEDIDAEDFDFICDNFQAPDRQRRLPGVIIIGARKGGTRALIEFLKLHPILKSSGPEIHFFDNLKNFALGLSWYLKQMPILEAGQIAMEKTPGYFHTPGVPERMSSVLLHTKFLLVVRDPVNRLISDYNQFRSTHLQKGEDYPPLEEFIFTPSGDINTSYPPLQRSIYHMHLARWLKSFPSSSFHIVNGDEFIAKPWEELQDVERFLGVYPHIQERNFYFNETKGFYCSRDIRSKGVWECSRSKCLSKSKGRKKPPVEAETVQRLRKYFKTHNEIFENMINRTFHWND